MKKEFKIIPGFSRYQIAKDGTLQNIKTLRIKKYYIADIGYESVRVTRDDNVSTISTHHRLKALAWIPHPGDVSKLDVNHIDGIKLNNELPNLEWLTRHGNCDHAYRTGLRDDNTPIMIEDIASSECKIFHSMGEAGRFFNVTAAAIHWQLNHPKPNKAYKGYWLSYAK